MRILIGIVAAGVVGGLVLVGAFAYSKHEADEWKQRYAAAKAEHRLAVDACLEKSGLPVVVTDGVQVAVGVGCAERIGELPTVLYLERKD